jgi:hypothetical protein
MLRLQRSFVRSASTFGQANTLRKTSDEVVRTVQRRRLRCMCMDFLQKTYQLRILICHNKVHKSPLPSTRLRCISFLIQSYLPAQNIKSLSLWIIILGPHSFPCRRRGHCASHTVFTIVNVYVIQLVYAVLQWLLGRSTPLRLQNPPGMNIGSRCLHQHYNPPVKKMFWAAAAVTLLRPQALHPRLMICCGVPGGL